MATIREYLPPALKITPSIREAVERYRLDQEQLDLFNSRGFWARLWFLIKEQLKFPFKQAYLRKLHQLLQINTDINIAQMQLQEKEKELALLRRRIREEKEPKL